MSELPLSTREEFEAHCRARASAVYVGQGTLLCRIIGRFLCYLDADDTAVTPHLAMDGFWEAWNTVALARHVRPGWRVVDVGANHGYFTLLLGALVGPKGHVFAVEPNPRLLSLLERTVRVNGFDDRVTVLPCAAASTNGRVDLRVPAGFSGDGSVVLRRDAALASEVDQRRLDSLIDGEIDLLKIDAEGADYDVLEGALPLMPRARMAHVLLEHYAPYYSQPCARLSRFGRDGFSVGYVTDEGDVEPATPSELAEQPGRLWNVWLSRAPMD